MTDLTDPLAERERQWQDAAERNPSEDAGEVEIELYRRVYTAVRQAELPEIPAGFALRMEREAFARKNPSRTEAVEEWGVHLGLCLLLILLLVTVAPAAHPWLDRWSTEPTPVPWLPAVASGAALVVWRLLDRPQRAG